MEYSEWEKGGTLRYLLLLLSIEGDWMNWRDEASDDCNQYGKPLNMLLQKLEL